MGSWLVFGEGKASKVIQKYQSSKSAAAEAAITSSILSCYWPRIVRNDLKTQ